MNIQESQQLMLSTRGKIYSRWHFEIFYQYDIWEAQNDMEAADREGLQRVEALGYQPS